MTQFIDRRINGKNKSAINRQRFLERHKSHIKKAMSHAIANRSISDMEKGETVKIPEDEIEQPRFAHTHGGINHMIHPGNKDYVAGDKIQRPPVEASGSGSKASNTGEGEDEFEFSISRDEFLDLYFEDLALPDLIKKQITKICTEKPVRAGVTTSGVPNNMNIIRTMRQSMARRISLGAPHKRELALLEQQLEQAMAAGIPDSKFINELKAQISTLQQRIQNIPFLDDVDIRYNNRVMRNAPSTQAVMFCLMDVSGSMDEEKKDIAKRFFILLYLFLNRNYDKIDLVFIRHHTSAKQVDEHEFFYSRETGGTVVSSALEMAAGLIKTDYSPNDWNIYVAQASDGDNWNADSPYCHELLDKNIMPFIQYYAYIEIMPRHHQSLWEAYLQVAEQHDNFAMQTIDTISDIYPVFRNLFKRQNA